MKKFFSNSVQISTTIALLFVAAIIFYACSTSTNPAPSALEDAKSSKNSVRIGDVTYTITAFIGPDFLSDAPDEPGGGLTPTCSCKGYGCSSQVYCTNGKSCSCLCSWWLGCWCTGCTNGRVTITFTNEHKKNRISLENYLQEQNNSKLSEASNLLVKIRKALEAEDINAYLESIEEGKTFNSTLSIEDKNIIQKWFTGNKFDVSF